MWRRRASYDPMKAAQEGKRKQEEAKRTSRQPQPQAERPSNFNERFAWFLCIIYLELSALYKMFLNCRFCFFSVYLLFFCLFSVYIVMIKKYRINISLSFFQLRFKIKIVPLWRGNGPLAS